MNIKAIKNGVECEWIIDCVCDCGSLELCITDRVIFINGYESKNILKCPKCNKEYYEWGGLNVYNSI